MIRFSSLMLIGSLAFSCINNGGGGGGSSSSSSSTITISGSLGVAKSSSKRATKGVDAVDLDSLKMFCVAFNANADSATSNFGSGGSFSVKGIPADTPFGCFVVQKSNSSIVATLKVEDTNTGMENESSSSMNLKKDVSLGSITLTEGEPTVSVPKTRIEAAQSTKTTSVSVDDIHETEWDLTCVDNSDSNCADFVAESPKVYFRILKATKNGGKNINGIGVWASETDFNACGGFDMTATEASSIVTDEGDGFNWTQNSEGNFIDNHSVCPKRDSGEAVSRDNIDVYYVMEKLVVSGTMFSLLQEDDYEEGNCAYYHKTAVSFSPKNTTTLYGSFETAEVAKETSSGGCDGSGGEEDSRASFVVKFSKR